LHFLNLREGYDEKELKDAIMDNSPKILLELDREFAFVSKEYPFLSEMLKNLLICCSTTYKTPLCFN